MAAANRLNPGKGVKAWQVVAAAFFWGTVLMAGCGGGDGGGDDGGTDTSSGIVISGRVLNNHTDEDEIDRRIAGARVILVNAGDAVVNASVSPIEDLAKATGDYPSLITDAEGYYQFTRNDFSSQFSYDGDYYVFVDPPATESELLPGGNAARASLSLKGDASVRRDIILSDTNGPDAGYIGTTVCLICHPQKETIKHTLHSVGIRKIGPDGTVTNGLMDMSDTSVYDLSSNNDEMLGKFTRPATRYTFPDDTATSFWLGRDDAGFYFQLTSDTNPRFYIKYTYGGETGIWRGLFMTTVYAGNGTYAADHGTDGDDYAYLVFAPFQYNEDPNSLNGEAFVPYNADSWDFEGAATKDFTGDPEFESFDLGCAGCHGAIGIETLNKGLSAVRRAAVFPEDGNGYTIDGVRSEINIGCEKCHGPGSGHVDAGGEGHLIISPELLPPGRLTMICGACHIRGENHTDIGGRVPLAADGNGNYETFMPGMSPARFFGTFDGTGKHVISFGTIENVLLSTDGYLEPINFETDASASWLDVRFGAVVNHSKAGQQQYADFVRTGKFRNDREILTCISCHDAHGSPYRHMVTFNADNNAVCLSCHSGRDRIFPNIDQTAVDRLKNNIATEADRVVIGKDVDAHIFDKTGTLQMGPYDPEGTAMGRCTLCHMPKTAKSADWHNALRTGARQYRHGDISSHTFDVMSTEAVNDMGDANGASNTTPAGITDKCGYCHGFAGLK